MNEYQSGLLKTASYCGFCDESQYNVGRFRAISMVSMDTSFFPSYADTLQEILDESGISELKWHDLASAKMRFAAIKSLDCTLDRAESGKLRVDTLIWDVQDTRHCVLKRDDIQNLQRMYYHLLNNVLVKKWGELGHWIVFPDHSSINWLELETVMQNQIKKMEDRKRIDDPYGINGMGFLELSPIDSLDCPIVQVADLFAGLGVHSRESFHKHESYYIVRRGRRCRYLPSRTIESVQDIVSSLSRSDRERCSTLSHLFSQCKAKKWGIHLLRSQGLKTSDPTCPINFWHYIPQSGSDRAPVRR
jgi:hypothetical protein